MEENKLNESSADKILNNPPVEDVFSNLESEKLSSEPTPIEAVVPNNPNINSDFNQNPIPESIPLVPKVKKDIISGNFLFIFFMAVIIVIGVFAIWALL